MVTSLGYTKDLLSMWWTSGSIFFFLPSTSNPLNGIRRPEYITHFWKWTNALSLEQQFLKFNPNRVWWARLLRMYYYFKELKRTPKTLQILTDLVIYLFVNFSLSFNSSIVVGTLSRSSRIPNMCICYIEIWGPRPSTILSISFMALSAISFFLYAYRI